MPKVRMTALDVRAMVSDVAPLVSRLRVANVYDISSKVYVLKLSEGDVKRHLVCEAGARFHLSQWKRDKQSIPSYFTMKLRKFLRTKRLASVRQLGADRVIDLQFGYEENAMHLLVELYSKGNVVLTDHAYIVKATWRQYRADEELAVRLNAPYPLAAYQESLRFVSCGLDAIRNRDIRTLAEWLDSNRQSFAPTEGSNKRKRKAQGASDEQRGTSVEDIMGRLMPVAHKGIVEWCSNELKLKGKCYDLQSLSSSPEILEDLLNLTNRLLDLWNEVSMPGMLGSTREDVPKVKGYMGFTSKEPRVNNDFSPLDFYNADEREEFDHFHECVDEFYSSVEVAKEERSKAERLHDLESKIEKIRRDQAERVARLQQERDLAERQASSVEHQVEFVSKALYMLSRAVSTGSDWKLIEQMVKEQRKANHFIASHIQRLNLEKNRFTLLLSDEMLESAEDDAPLIPVELVIGQSAFANVQRLHEDKKAANAKFLKTEEAAKRVVAAAEQAAEKEKQHKELRTETRPAMQRLRKVFWFERFYWFISSDGYLVLAGRDAQQNEILYRKYLRKNDIYVHAEVHGAASCVIRNLRPEVPVPTKTIEEAGLTSVCRSNAWKTKVLVQAYWVYAYQVSKTPQPGEFVSMGGFIIRGKRNPIQIKKLEIGIGVMFHLGDAESIRRHLKPHQLEQLNLSPVDIEMLPSLAPESPEVGMARPDGQLGPEAASSSSQFSGTGTDQMKLQDSKVDDSDGSDGRERHAGGPLSAVDGGKESSDVESEADDSSVEISPVIHPSSLKHSSKGSQESRVQFGSIEVLPTPAIVAHVDFDDLPPEVIPIHSERRILSEEEDDLPARVRALKESDREAAVAGLADAPDLEEEDVDDPQKGSPRSLPRGFELRRPDSADELPPPAPYAGRSAPKDLLARRTPETAAVFLMEESDEGFGAEEAGAGLSATVPVLGSNGFPAMPPKHTKSCPTWSHRRRLVVDGGPLPRGYLEDEVPAPRTLLKLGFSASQERLVPPPSEIPDEKESSSSNGGHDASIEASEPADVRSPTVNSKARISKAARRQLKKGSIPQSQNKEVSKLVVGPESEVDEVADSNRKGKDANVSRIKQRKLRKMRDKYAEQSDEERELAMQLIGAKKLKEEIEEKPADKKPDVNWSTIVKSEAPPDRNIAEEEFDVEDDEEWKKRLGVTHELTGMPSDKDVILCALPVCAPLSALKGYKFTGKLLPGGGKKGKAVQLIHQAFVAMSPPGSILRQTIKQISADEISACIVSNPTVQIQGGDQIQKAERKAKKALGKAIAKAAAT